MNSQGRIFRLTTYGESHGPAIGGVIDGCPAGLTLDLAQVQTELDRRRPGLSRIASQRKEKDMPEILSGIFEGKTTGAPIGFLFRNDDIRKADYEWLKDTYRPGHADFTYESKYGLRDYFGGGRSSARETANWVFAGAVARQFLAVQGINVNAWVRSIGELDLPDDPATQYLGIRWDNEVRCPNPQMAARMFDLIDRTRKEGDSLGGVIECSANGVPVGLGEPIFDKVHARLAHSMLTINAAKGFEIGSGFESARMKGSEHNDLFGNEEGKISTLTNHSGGVLGGITNGAELRFRVAFKPVSTIMRPQQSMNKAGEEVTLEPRGRHDPCVVPRAVPIVEALTCLVLADFLLLARTNRAE